MGHDIKVSLKRGDKKSLKVSPNLHGPHNWRLRRWKPHQTQTQSALRRISVAQRLLERVDLFETLQPQEFENLAAGIQQRSFKAYETIVEENQEDQSMYILVEGLLEVHATSDDGTEVKIGILTPGQFFGEMSLLTGEPRSATVRAATNTLAYEITKDDLLPLLEQRPKLAEDMAAAMADRQVAAYDAQEKHLRETQIIHSREGLTKSLLGKVRGLFRLES
ncbi:cyclic nucleotide-binding domain-containing protein [bacterium]|nr:cyclic nucleotide-binding domain-containing protein [bacterium]MDB4432115.1 cyclic nucleotide-binding domain-containing protein [Akkermansiaceae bacterium]MDB4503812.1 cyclic nucleotide-binding domain-containing protein [Akkermansiaceae bacterium]MDB4607581.1 cyclic nucleotide-binding domain-containing protein [bacterium]MDB4672925.1 cyclic nucleotide-binding domain-containing protein [Akkermansiaceae bacterium]